MELKANDRILFVMLLLYFVSIYISDTLPGGQILTVFPIGIMLLIEIWQNKGKIRLYTKGYFFYIISFTVFCTLSRIWAKDPSLAVSKVNSLIFILLAAIPVVLCIYEWRDIDMLLKVIMYGGYIVCLYMIVRYGLRGILSILSNSSRLTNEVINANSLGMCTAYSLVINLYFIIYDQLKIRDLFMIPAFVVLAASGSRKAILIVIAGTFGVFVLKNTDYKRTLRNIARVILISFVVVALIFVLSRLPVFAVITRRMMNLVSLLQGNETRSTSDAWIRLAYNALGIQLFKQHPVLGIGIANANLYTSAYYGHNHYLHNNYIELLACGGLVGFFIYYSVWIYLLIVFWKSRKYRDRQYDICFILLLINVVMDYGLVTYYDKATYLFLLLFWMEKDNLKEQKQAFYRGGILS